MVKKKPIKKKEQVLKQISTFENVEFEFHVDYEPNISHRGNDFAFHTEL